MQTAAGNNRRAVSIWLWTGAGLIFLMLIIGGITRLTGSGLSMTDWNLLLGAVPPIDHASWKELFSQYKQFPEYQQLNAGMTLAEFKNIFFWEYLHRLTGRLIGLVFLVPFLWFWYRGYFDKVQVRRLSLLFLLGAAQGAMGWIMVKSGLSDNPYVSHYRLAMHLILAFLLFGYCIWLALDRGGDSGQGRQKGYTGTEGLGFNLWMYGFAAVLLLQVVWGALVAGLKAGYIYNTFPLMNGGFLPGNAWAMDPLLLNLVENPGLVQWSHRILGTLLLVAAFIFWFRMRTRVSGTSSRYALLTFVSLIAAQYLLGIFTLVYNVPVGLGVAHQAVALLILGAWIFLLYETRDQKNFI